MPTFSKTSKLRLASCHPDLITLMNDVIQITDFSILCGHRGEKEQNEAYAKGNSTLKFPKSKHNAYPSMAVDIAPYPIDWSDTKRFKDLAGLVLNRAMSLYKDNKITHKVEWGGAWKTFVDMPHFQLR